MHVLESAVGLVDAVLRLVLGDVAVGIVGEVLVEDDVLRPRASHREGIAYHAPLRLAIKAQALAQVVEETRQHHPARMAVAADCLGGLQQVLDLGEIGIGIAVVDQGVQEFGGFPHRLFALLQAEVFLLLAEHVIDRLVFVIQAVELRHAGLCLGVVHAKLFLAAALFVAAFEEFVPLFQIVERLGSGWMHGNLRSRFAGSAGNGAASAAAMASYSRIERRRQVAKRFPGGTVISGRT